MNKEHGDILSDLNVLYTPTELSTAIVLKTLSSNMLVYITRIVDGVVITDECLIVDVIDQIVNVNKPEIRLQKLILKFRSDFKLLTVNVSAFFKLFTVLSMEPTIAETVNERLVQYFGYKSDPYEIGIHETEEIIDMDAIMEAEFSRRLIMG